MLHNSVMFPKNILYAAPVVKPLCDPIDYLFFGLLEVSDILLPVLSESPVHKPDKRDHAVQLLLSLTVRHKTVQMASVRIDNYLHILPVTRRLKIALDPSH